MELAEKYPNCAGCPVVTLRQAECNLLTTHRSNIQAALDTLPASDELTAAEQRQTQEDQAALDFYDAVEKLKQQGSLIDTQKFIEAYRHTYIAISLLNSASDQSLRQRQFILDLAGEAIEALELHLSVITELARVATRRCSGYMGGDCQSPDTRTF